MVLWDGACHVHTAFSLDKIAVLKQKYPNAQLIAHPESAETILEMASYVGSTSNMINHIVKSEHQTFIVATEIGILHKLRTMTPNKILVPAPISENNSCACSECEYMKRNTLDKLLHCLEHRNQYNWSKRNFTEKSAHSNWTHVTYQLKKHFMHKCDFLIVGSGLAGLYCAIELAQD